MYKDLITYKLAPEITQDHLLEIAGNIVESWMRKQPGFIAWEINKDGEGNYMDIVYWESEEDAKKAEAQMVNIPKANEWYACYAQGSISSKKLYLVEKLN